MLLSVLLIASALAWVVAGRILAPLRVLDETARSISESDLTHRIERSGGGEAAEDYSAVIRIDPKNANAHRGRGNARA